MAQRTRIINVAKHEQLVVRVDKHAWKVVLEFEGSMLTVFEQHGQLFTRQELLKPDDDDATTASLTEDEDDDSNIETQPMTPLQNKRRSSVDILKNVTIRKRLSMVQQRDLEELQLELFGDFDAGDTQLDI